MPFCALCGKKVRVLHRHHIVPRKAGGSDEPSNIISLCPSYHKKVEIGSTLFEGMWVGARLRGLPFQLFKNFKTRLGVVFSSSALLVLLTEGPVWYDGFLKMKRLQEKIEWKKDDTRVSVEALKKIITS